MKKYHFAYSRCTGSIDDHDLRIHVLSFQVQSKGLTYVREVLDFRELRNADRLTVQGMIEISELERRRSEDRDFRLAIVTNRPLFEKIGNLYAQVIGTANLRVTVIGDHIEKALAWLGYAGDRAAQVTHFMDTQRHARHA